MSQMPPPIEPPGQPPLFNHYSQPPSDRARRLIRLVVIFNYISVGLDVCGSLLGIGVGAFFLAFPDLAPKDPGDPPSFIIAGIYLTMGCLAAIYAIVKTIGTRKLHMGHPNAWAWGLTAGIIGCAQVLCGNCCCLQVAAGVYNIVVMCLEDVRHYLASTEGQGRSIFES